MRDKQSDLLAKQKASDFTTKKYWDDFFEALPDSSEPFEWYGSWKDFKNIVVRKLLTNGISVGSFKDLKVLVIGCGNSDLSYALYKTGFKSILSVDYSEMVIKQMNERYGDVTGLEFQTVDVLNIPESMIGKYDLILDKGCLDAIYSVKNDATIKRKGLMLLENVSKMLQPECGFYFCISLLQPFVFSMVFNEFYQNIDSDHTLKAVDSFQLADSKLSPFVLTLCRKKDLVDQKDKWVINDNIYAKESEDQPLNHFELSLQMLINDCRSSNDLRSHVVEPTTIAKTEITVEGTLKYKIYLVSSGAKDVNIPLAAFVVPQGRDTEFLFGVEEGMIELASTNSLKYLFVAQLSRDFDFNVVPLAEIQKDISPYIKNIFLKYRSSLQLPLNFEFESIPILGIGADESQKVGQRKVVVEIETAVSGKIGIEDVQVEGAWYRRMLFQNSGGIQTEALLQKNGNLMAVDNSSLSFECHEAILSSLLLLKSSSISHIISVGIGGGSLVTHLLSLASVFADSKMTAIEIDAEVVSLAVKHFDYPESDPRLTTVVDDGYKFLTENNGRYDCVLLDVDNKQVNSSTSTKDPSKLIAPPAQFLDIEFLKHIKSNLLPAASEGCFSMNLASPHVDVIATTIKKLKIIFDEVYICKLPYSCNYIILCVSSPNSEKVCTLEDRKVFAKSKLPIQGISGGVEDYLDIFTTSL